MCSTALHVSFDKKQDPAHSMMSRIFCTKKSPHRPNSTSFLYCQRWNKSLKCRGEKKCIWILQEYMSEPAGNYIKKNQQHWLPLLPIYFYDLGFTLRPEVEDVCARVCACTQTGVWSEHVMFLLWKGTRTPHQDNGVWDKAPHSRVPQAGMPETKTKEVPKTRRTKGRHFHAEFQQQSIQSHKDNRIK